MVLLSSGGGGSGSSSSSSSRSRNSNNGGGSCESDSVALSIGGGGGGGDGWCLHEVCVGVVDYSGGAVSGRIGAGGSDGEAVSETRQTARHVCHPSLPPTSHMVPPFVLTTEFLPENPDTAPSGLCRTTRICSQIE